MSLVDKFLNRQPLRELEKNSSFKYSIIQNWNQFNEGIEFLSNQIKLIRDLIDDSIDDNLIFSGILNESKANINQIWENTKNEIDIQNKKVDRVREILLDFLQEGSVIINNNEMEITSENISYYTIIIDSCTDEVEFIINKYYKTINKFKVISYPLDDIIRIFNLSIDNFNRVLDEYRRKFNIISNNLPDAKKVQHHNIQI